MNCIQNSWICTPTSCNVAIVGSIAAAALTGIALGIIGFTALPSGPFNAIVQLGKTANGILLGVSIFVCILDIVWLGALCKKTNAQPQSSLIQVSQQQLNHDKDAFDETVPNIIISVGTFDSKVLNASKVQVTSAVVEHARGSNLDSSETSQVSHANTFPLLCKPKNSEALQGRALQTSEEKVTTYAQTTSSISKDDHQVRIAVSNTVIPVNHDEDVFEVVPSEVKFMIFGHLTTTQQAACIRVSKSFCQLLCDKDLLNACDPNVSPLIKVFNADEWKKHVDMSTYGLTTEDEVYCDLPKSHTLLERRLIASGLITEIEGNEGVTVLTIPNGLTLNKLLNIAGLPQKHPSKFRGIWDLLPENIKDTPITKTHQIVITNNILKDSRLIPLLVAAELRKFNCEIPTILEITALLVVTFMSTGKRLYNDNPLTYTLCREKVDLMHKGREKVDLMHKVRLEASLPMLASILKKSTAS